MYKRQALEPLVEALAPAAPELELTDLAATPADGLDSAGHRAAVKENCPTIGVPGVPIDRTLSLIHIWLWPAGGQGRRR